MRTKGKFLNKQIWFSICSRHREYDEACDLCKIGEWENALKYKFSSFIYDNFPSIWRWYMNKY